MAEPNDNDDPQNDPDSQNDPAENDDEVEDLRVQLAESKKELAELRKKKSPRRRRAPAKQPARARTPDEDDTEDEAQEAHERWEEAKRENEELTGKLRKVRAQNIAAGIRGVVDPEAVVALLDWDELEDPDDTAEVKSAMKELLKSKPYLVKNVGLDGGQRAGRPGQKETMNDLFRRKVRAQRR